VERVSVPGLAVGWDTWTSRARCPLVVGHTRRPATFPSNSLPGFLANCLWRGFRRATPLHLKGPVSSKFHLGTSGRWDWVLTKGRRKLGRLTATESGGAARVGIWVEAPNADVHLPCGSLEHVQSSA
jgi:hypothetical protein